MGDWADKWTASKTPEHMQQILKTSTAAWPKSLYNLAAHHQQRRRPKAGDRFTKKWFFNLLGMHDDSCTATPAWPADARQHAYSAGDRRRAPL